MFTPIGAEVGFHPGLLHLRLPRHRLHQVAGEMVAYPVVTVVAVGVVNLNRTA